MHVLFFDTETNGLPPRDRNCLSSDVDKWPHIVQIAWQVWDFAEDPVLINAYVAILKPEPNLVWNEGSQKIHGISREKALTEGLPGNEVFAEFTAAAGTADIIIAHNLAFDKPVVMAAYYRINSGEKFSWWPSQNYCTMDNTKALCKLPSKFARPSDPYKWPSLGELYKFLFGTTSELSLHSADADVECLVTCFRELVRREVVPLETWRRVLRARATART